MRPDLTTASRGYNGFPRGIADTPGRLNDREVKYELVVHAETNALLTAREPLHGYTLYCTFPPCSRCAVSIIQAGIVRVVAIKPTAEQEERWGFWRTRDLFKEAGIDISEYPIRDVVMSAAEDGVYFTEKLMSKYDHACSCEGH